MRGNSLNRQLNRSVFVPMAIITNLPPCRTGPPDGHESKAIDILVAHE